MHPDICPRYPSRRTPSGVPNESGSDRCANTEPEPDHPGPELEARHGWRAPYHPPDPPQHDPHALRPDPGLKADPNVFASLPPAGDAAGASAQEELSVPVEGLVYVLDRLPDPRGKKSVVGVHREGEESIRPLVDRVDLFAFRSRQAFARLVSDYYGLQVQVVMGHLALVLDTLERAQPLASPASPVELTSERREAARELLAAPDLLERVGAAAEALGYVGEERNKRLAYLIATSRLLPKPLSAILLAPSGCGKSGLLEAVEALLPPEHVVFLSRLTPQALFYAGPDQLRHKLVLVDEHEGASEADYSIRTLQSKGFLTLRSPGRGEVRVEGPISLMSGTTSSDLNPENLSRCLELALDDSPAQTRRIHEAQRRAWAGKRPPKLDRQPFRDAQRLLESVPVVIPFAEQLRFPARTTHDRRGNQKLLGLVAAHALLHQRQRERDARGQVLAAPADYAAVYELLLPVVREDLDGLSPRAARAYRELAERGRQTRRDLSNTLGWSYNTAKRALAELVAQELVTEAESGPPAVYRVLEANALGTTSDLTPPTALGA